MITKDDAKRIPFLAKSRNTGTIIEVTDIGVSLSGTVVEKGATASVRMIPGYFSNDWTAHVFEYFGPATFTTHESLTVGDLA